MNRSPKLTAERHFSTRIVMIGLRSVKASVTGQVAKRAAGAAVSIAMICGVGAMTMSPASAAVTPVSSKVHTVKFSRATESALRKLESTPRGQAELLRAMQSSFGRVAKITATPSIGGSRIVPDLTCSPGVSCGLSKSGGWHFWIIMSYATALSADLAALQPYCWAALVPLAGPFGAAACLSIGAILWAMVNNWPRMTNHGVWLSVYFWGIQDGRY